MPKVLGIDFGNSRIGLALGEDGITTPSKIINGKNWDGVLSDIKKIIEENDVSYVVLGVTKNRKSNVDKFKEFLKDNIRLPIEFFNEDFTSKEALEYSIKMGYSKKGRRYLDDVAACMILNRFFEN
ncbi:MAG: Holliday junction resolvase RuvX [bacterium]